MQILKKAFGEYVTNCYILKGEQGDLVIDPGQGSFDWVITFTTTPSCKGWALKFISTRTTPLCYGRILLRRCQNP